MTLTDEQLNLAICEWRGWEFQSNDPQPNESVRPPSGPLVRYSSVPSHIIGIEALGNMHEVIMSLNNNMRDLVNDQLVEDTGAGVDSTELSDLDAAINATARQRAIALLHVVKPELFQ